MNDWDPLEHGRAARVAAAWKITENLPNTENGFHTIAKAFGFEDWDALREGTTPDMIPQLKALAGPNGYAILKAMLAKRS